ncbi:biopolymer transporter ExbD [Stieleria sp.]|uniref:Biopolymer transport protein ExbD n=1 Tax=Stieleria magnilauensis TaxID=2527963 RepID=A0ABX5XNJ6_9BACT|nr:biopolymer transporter ExbD [Phycisphaera sp. RhM]QDV82941.1 Biopolymer transport protein ExbD [Planctomycetes bacterium TBK1r]
MAKRNRSDDDVTINLTPMIDVVFLLVIFFMVGTKFSESESRIDVSVPSVGPMHAISRVPDERVVELTADGNVLLDGQVVNNEQLAEILASQYAQYPDLKVVVRADSAGSLQGFAETIHTVRRSGVAQIGIAVKVDAGGGGGMLR